MKKYFVELDAKRIHIPTSRWYEIGNYEKTGKAYPSVTSVLDAKSKGGLENWKVSLARMGIDPKEESMRVMNYGSTVHDAAEKLMCGEQLTYSDDYDFWNEWLPIIRFVRAFKEHSIKPVLIEQTIWSNELQVAGTMDLFCYLKPKGRKTYTPAVVDLKRSSSVMVPYQWQIAAYKKMLIEMIEKPCNESKKIVSWLSSAIKKDTKELIKELKSAKAYILLLNVQSRAGWRLTEITDLDTKLSGFKYCNGMFRIENPNLRYVKELYPTELKLEL